jgi:hypothetical protein
MGHNDNDGITVVPLRSHCRRWSHHGCKGAGRSANTGSKCESSHDFLMRTELRRILGLHPGRAESQECTGSNSNVERHPAISRSAAQKLAVAHVPLASSLTWSLNAGFLGPSLLSLPNDKLMVLP